jgi:hypothetical protein
MLRIIITRRFKKEILDDAYMYDLNTSIETRYS